MTACMWVQSGSAHTDGGWWTESEGAWNEVRVRITKRCVWCSSVTGMVQFKPLPTGVPLKEVRWKKRTKLTRHKRHKSGVHLLIRFLKSLMLRLHVPLVHISYTVGLSSYRSFLHKSWIVFCCKYLLRSKLQTHTVWFWNIFETKWYSNISAWNPQNLYFGNHIFYPH